MVILTENARPERGMRGTNQGACKTASAISLASSCCSASSRWRRKSVSPGARQMPVPAAAMPNSSSWCSMIFFAEAICPVSRVNRTKMFHVKHFGFMCTRPGDGRNQGIDHNILLNETPRRGLLNMRKKPQENQPLPPYFCPEKPQEKSAEKPCLSLLYPAPCLAPSPHGYGWPCAL